MKLIVHKIRLLDASHHARFENWVVNADYATCPDLPSVVAFSVQRADSEVAFDYFEVIAVRSQEAFETDMQGVPFAGLVAAFSGMAEVVDEFSGERLGEGYVTGE